MPPAPAWDRRANCPAQHSVSNGHTWTRGENEALGVIICADGRPMYKLRCRVCGTAGTPVSTRLLAAWGLGPADLEWEQRNEPRRYDPCVVANCGVTPTEYHHFAPRNTFGDEADSWPYLPLCRAHHVEWHTRMDGYRWHRKGVAA